MQNPLRRMREHSGLTTHKASYRADIAINTLLRTEDADLADVRLGRIIRLAQVYGVKCRLVFG